MNRGRLLAFVIAATLVVAAVAAFLGSIGPSAGPLVQLSQTTVSHPTTADEEVTWGVHLPRNPTEADIVILSAEPVEVQGITVLGVTMLDLRGRDGIGIALGYPPEGVNDQPVEGLVLGPAAGPGTSLQVLVGARLADGRGSGRIGGLRIRYESGGREHEYLVPQALELGAASPEPSPPRRSLALLLTLRSERHCPSAERARWILGQPRKPAS